MERRPSDRNVTLESSAVILVQVVRVISGRPKRCRVRAVLALGPRKRSFAALHNYSAASRCR